MRRFKFRYDSFETITDTSNKEIMNELCLQMWHRGIRHSVLGPIKSLSTLHLPQCQGLGQCPPPARLCHDAIRESFSHLKTDIYQLIVELSSQTRVGQVVRRDCGHAAGAQGHGHCRGGRPHLLLHDLWP